MTKEEFIDAKNITRLHLMEQLIEGMSFGDPEAKAELARIQSTLVSWRMEILDSVLVIAKKVKKK